MEKNTTVNASVSATFFVALDSSELPISSFLSSAVRGSERGISSADRTDGEDTATASRRTEARLGRRGAARGREEVREEGEKWHV